MGTLYLALSRDAQMEYIYIYIVSYNYVTYSLLVHWWPQRSPKHKQLAFVLRFHPDISDQFW